MGKLVSQTGIIREGLEQADNANPFEAIDLQAAEPINSEATIIKMSTQEGMLAAKG